MTDRIIHLNTHEQLKSLIARALDLKMPWRAELYRAVRDCVIDVVEIQRVHRAPMGVLKRSLLPVCVIVGDDDYHSTDPNGWTATPRLIAWSKGAMIHAGGGDAASYQMVIRMAVASRRFLLVETDFRHMREWGGRLLTARPPVPFLALQPRDGQHLVLPSRHVIQ